MTNMMLVLCLFLSLFLSLHAASWLQSSDLQLCPSIRLTHVRNPEYTELMIQSNKKANRGWQNAEQKPANWLQEGG